MRQKRDNNYSSWIFMLVRDFSCLISSLQSLYLQLSSSFFSCCSYSYVCYLNFSICLSFSFIYLPLVVLSTLTPTAAISPQQMHQRRESFQRRHAHHHIAQTSRLWFLGRQGARGRKKETEYRECIQRKSRKIKREKRKISNKDEQSSSSTTLSSSSWSLQYVVCHMWIYMPLHVHISSTGLFFTTRGTFEWSSYEST